MHPFRHFLPPLLSATGVPSSTHTPAAASSDAGMNAASGAVELNAGEVPTDTRTGLGAAPTGGGAPQQVAAESSQGHGDEKGEVRGGGEGEGVHSAGGI